MKRWIAMVLVFALLLPGMIPAAGAEEETAATEITEETTLPTEEPAEETEAPAEELEVPAEEPTEALEEDWEEVPIEDVSPDEYYYIYNDLGTVTFGKNYTPALASNYHNCQYYYTVIIEEVCELVVAFTIFSGNIDEVVFQLEEQSKWGSEMEGTIVKPTQSTSSAGANYNYSYTRKYLLQPGTYVWRFKAGNDGRTHNCKSLTFNQYEHSHDYSYKTWTQGPSCEIGGYWAYQCKCGTIMRYPDGSQALGHKEVADAAVAATCTTTGKTAGSHCSVCKKVLTAQTTIPALDHDYEVIDCTDNMDGTHTASYVCSRDSGHTQTVTEDHKYENGKCICGAKEFVILLGDLDLDGDADAFDLTILARHVGGIEEVTDAVALANADVTGDGGINANDLTKHARFVGGIITSWDQE